MSTEPIEFNRSPLPVPSSYEQCVAEHSGLKADYVVSPLQVAALMLDWDEEDDY